MNLNEQYRRKLTSVDQALQNVQSNQEIVSALATCEPAALLSQLHTIRDRVVNVSVVSAMMQNQYDFFLKPEMKDHFILNSWFYTDAASSVQKNLLGNLEHVLFTWIPRCSRSNS